MEILKIQKMQGPGAAKALVGCRGNTRFTEFYFIYLFIYLFIFWGGSPQSYEEIKQFSVIVASPDIEFESY